METRRIAIYGVGAFGYAMLKHLDNKQDGSYEMTGYDHVAEVTSYLREHRSHPYFHTDTKISDMPDFVQSPGELLGDADTVILAVSSDATREVAQNIKQYAKPGLTILNAAKALDKTTGQRLSEVIEEELAGFDHEYALIAGGTTADDLFRHEPLGADLASANAEIAAELKQLLLSDNLSVYATTDVLGVEYAAALKNTVSIMAGIVHGLGFSYGSETHIISKTAQEIGDVCVEQLGAKPDTFSVGRQCWGNDMWMSCTGDTRNRQLGELLGKGTPVEAALKQMHEGNKLVEGVNTLHIVDKLAGLKDVYSIKLLHDLIVERTIGVEDIRSYLLNK